MNQPSVAELVKLYGLLPHPEGGFFKETYRAAGSYGNRNYSTAIYFLLPRGTMSRMHRIASDELWHFYLGGPLTVVQISPEGALETITLGPDVLAGQKLQHVVPAGYWFGSYPGDAHDYSLVGCTVSPGFDFADFELARRADLVALYPRHRAVIERLTD